MINIGELQMINIVEPQLERGDTQFSEEIETANPRPDDRLPHPRRRSRSFRSRTLTAGLNLCRNSRLRRQQRDIEGRRPINFDEVALPEILDPRRCGGRWEFSLDGYAGDPVPRD
jgi:hypothetical protein